MFHSSIAPSEFLDPTTQRVMKTPVKLKSTGAIVDELTAKTLNFTSQDYVVETGFKQRIDEWRRVEKRSLSVTPNTNYYPTPSSNLSSLSSSIIDSTNVHQFTQLGHSEVVYAKLQHFLKSKISLFKPDSDKHKKLSEILEKVKQKIASSEALLAEVEKETNEHTTTGLEGIVRLNFLFKPNSGYDFYQYFRDELSQKLELSSESSSKEHIPQRICIVGEAGAGSYSLMKRYTDDLFNDTYLEHKEYTDFKIRTVSAEDHSIKQIISPQSAGKCYIRFGLIDNSEIDEAVSNSDLIISTFNLTDDVTKSKTTRTKSVSNIKTQLLNIKKHAKGPVILVGTHNDKTDEIKPGTKEEFTKLALELELTDCFFVSSKTGAGVEELFQYAAKCHLNYLRTLESPNPSRLNESIANITSAFRKMVT